MSLLACAARLKVACGLRAPALSARPYGFAAGCAPRAKSVVFAGYSQAPRRGALRRH